MEKISIEFLKKVEVFKESKYLPKNKLINLKQLFLSNIFSEK